MRNLKKFLALVLAMMMVFGLMVTVNAASFTDSADVSDKYSTAVEVLYALGVINGYETSDGTFEFRPEINISRAEFATILYHIGTGDVEHKNIDVIKAMEDKDSLFTDLNGHWASGYINYVGSKGWMTGDGKGKFNPGDNVTGQQVLMSVLRVLGYDANSEFTGKPNWDSLVEQYARQLGLIDGTEGLLSTPASRELIAQLAFNTLMSGKMVRYNAITGEYDATIDSIGRAVTLGAMRFNLKNLLDPATTLTDAEKEIRDEAIKTDEFGRPGQSEVWVSNGTVLPMGESTKVIDFDKAMTEGEIFTAIGARGIATATENGSRYIVMDKIYVNGNTPVATSKAFKDTGTTEADKDSDGKYTGTIVYWGTAGTGSTDIEKSVVIAKGDSTNTSGFGNGTIVEIYDNSAVNGENHYIMVVIEQYVGEVTKVNAATEDDARSIVINGDTSLTFETEDFAKDDVVLYTVANGEVYSVVPAGTVTGTVTKIEKSAHHPDYDVYTIGESTVRVSAQAAGRTSAETSLSLALKTEGTWYTDSFGNVIKVKEITSEGDTDDEDTIYYGWLTAYAFEAGSTNVKVEKDGLGNITQGANNKTIGEIFTFKDANGNSQTLNGAYDLDSDKVKIEVGVAGEGTKASGDKYKSTDGVQTAWTSAKKNILFGYKLNSKGEICEVFEASTASATSITKGDPKVEVSSGPSTYKYANSNTVYFLISNDMKTITACVGYMNVPAKQSDSPVTYMLDENGNVAAVALVLKANESASGQAKVESFVYFASLEVTKQTVDEDTDSYTYTDVYINGEKSTIMFDHDVVAGDEHVAAGDVWIFGINDDGYAELGDAKADLTSGGEVKTIEANFFTYEDSGSDIQIVYVGSSTVYYQLDTAAKTMTVVEGLPSNVAEGYKLNYLYNTAGTSVDAPAGVVIFSVDAE